MFGNAVLEVAIGLAFIYVLLSLLCTSLMEFVSSILSLRAKNLKVSLARLLGGTDLKSIESIFEHPLIRGAAPNRGFFAGDAKSVPDYIPAGHFVEVLLETLSEETHVIAHGKIAGDKRPPKDREELESLVSKITDENLRKVMRGILGGVKGEIKEARMSIESWYDESMDRVRGSYARYAQRMTLFLACILVVTINADTLMMTQVLWKDSSLRSVIVTAAETAAREREAGPETTDEELQKNPPASSQETKSPIQAYAELVETGFPFGWVLEPKKAGDPREFPSDLGGRVQKIIGLLMTAFGVSLGAPFWFDLIGKLASIRSSGSPVRTKRDQEKENSPR